MKVNVQLPIDRDMESWIKEYKHLKNVACVYKINFNCGMYYIGMTNNLMSRVYAHSKITDLNDKSKPTKKHLRMMKAIEYSEMVIFEVLDLNPENERLYIELSERSLNSKR
jgi:transcriptional regulatory protein LevR